MRAPRPWRGIAMPSPVGILDDMVDLADEAPEIAAAVEEVVAILRTPEFWQDVGSSLL